MYEHDMQLPYDRCIEIDKEVDTLLEEEKKKQQINERKAKLMTDSKKSRHFTIYKWLGWNFMLEYLSGCVLFVILFIPVMFVLLVLASVANSKHFKGDYDIEFINLIEHIMPSPQKYIEKKMSKKNYLIPENVIDCPISYKKLLSIWLFSEFEATYIKAVKGELLFYSEDGKLIKRGDDMIIPENHENIKKFCNADNKEKKYLTSQMIDSRFYKISDIITDVPVEHIEK